jgi:membrane-anchored protein YejM (alkaline phosphatase superfamily)
LALKAWESFYVIVGSSAGALIGLQFVVITIIAESRMRSTGNELAAFGTPTVLHFVAVLLIAAIISAPWPSLALPSLAIGLSGAFGLAYQTVVLVRTQKQTVYKMVLEDWVWHIVLPFAAYIGLASGSVMLQSHPARALFDVGGASLLLLFIGIHNAWDTTTWVLADAARRRLGEAEKTA